MADKTPTTEQEPVFDSTLKKKKKKKSVAFSEDPLGADADDIEPASAPVSKASEDPAPEDTNMFEGMKKKKKKKVSLPDTAEEPVIAGAPEQDGAPEDAPAADTTNIFEGMKKKKKKKEIAADVAEEVVASPDPQMEMPSSPAPKQNGNHEEAPAEDDANMFEGMKKKKKKKEIPLDLGEESSPAPAESVASMEEGGKEDAAVDEASMFEGLKKKKKKKEIPLDLGEPTSETAAPEGSTQDGAEGEFDFSDMKKKKKKSAKKALDLEAFERELEEANAAPAKEEKKAKKVKAEDGEEEEEGEEDDVDDVDGDLGDEDPFAEDEVATVEEGAESWQGTDRDYTYNELLGRFFRILRAQNPELAGEKRRYTIVPPSVHREGNKKTIFANVVDIAKRMHRQPDHVISFLFAELGTTGSVDGSSRLVIKGRFQQKQLENVLRRYIVEYVTCKTCKSPETLLSKDNRIYFVTCESCGSRRSVSAVKAGFQAQVGKRSRTKAAT